MKAKLLSEFLGPGFLVMIVLGSGIMAQNLFPDQDGLALLANSLATGAGLLVLIQSLGPISGSHLNPVVSMVEALWGRLSGKDAMLYALCQMIGALMGVVLTRLMFNLSPWDLSIIQRDGIHLWLSEVIATFGLISVIALSGKKHVEFAPMSIAAYITSAYWFTSSTSFANPAVTFARIFTNTFGGMDPKYLFPLCLSQIVGAILAWLLFRKS